MIAATATSMSDPAVPTSPAIPSQPEVVVEYQAPPRDQLAGRTIKGGLWTVGGYAVVQFVRLASNLILTRLLAKELFGVMLVVNTVMTGIRLFSDVGIGPAVIANPKGDSEPFLRTAWTTQVMRGFAIWCVAIALAIPVAHSYAKIDPATGIADDPIMLLLSKLLPVAGFVAVLEGFRSTAIFRLQRKLRFAEQQMLDLIEIGVTVVGMVVWAWLAVNHFHVPMEKAVWALVIPPLMGSFASMVASHLVMRDRHDRLGWDRLCAKEMMRIGRWVFVSTALLFLAGQFDRLIFAKVENAGTLGVYGIATTLAIMPTIAVMKVGQAVLFPTFSRVAGDLPRFIKVYRKARTMLLVIGAMLVSGMIAAGPAAIHGMYKPEYADAGWMIQLLAIGVWFQVVDATNVAGLLAREHPNWMAGGNGTKVAFMFALVPVAYHFGWGFGGALVALAIADGLRALFSTIGIARKGIATRQTLLPDVVLPVLAGAIGLIMLKVSQIPAARIDAMIGGGPKVHRILANGAVAAIAGVLVLAVWAPICLWQWKAARRQSA